MNGKSKDYLNNTQIPEQIIKRTKQKEKNQDF